MFSGFVIFLPLFVSLVLSLLLALDLIDEHDRYIVRTKTCLLAFILACLFLYLGHATYFSYGYELIPFTDSLYCFCSPAVYPLYYIYLSELSNSRTHWYSDLGWLLPPLACGVAVTVCYLLMDPECTRLFIEHYLYRNSSEGLTGAALAQVYAHLTEKWVFGLEIIPLAMLALRKIRHYSNMVSRSYADASQHSLVMLRLMFVLFLVTSMLSAVSNALGRYRFLDDIFMLAFPSVMFGLLIFMQVYIGIRYNYPAIAADSSDDAKSNALTASIGQASLEQLQTDDKNNKARQEAAERMRNLRRRIEKLMDEEKIFLQNGLKISDLAEQLCCNRNYIYRAINVEMGISFAEYVNKKRVDYAKQMIEQKPDLQMNELYMRVGFSSSSSFYRCFRLFEGCTPKELQERLRKEKNAQ